MRLAILASGSGGNALLVEAGSTSLLVDCGISLRRVSRCLAELGSDVGRLAAVLVTHEHGDHVRGLEVFQRRHAVPVLATEGTAAASAGLRTAGRLVAGRELAVGGLTVLPFQTCHDAREPVGFVISDNVMRVGVMTDTGMVTGAALEALRGCHALLVECNHDREMLLQGGYPWPLKQRITSRVGHLCNEQGRDVVETLAHPGLQVVVGMHLSQENNLPSLVRRELERVLAGSNTRIAVAHQTEGVVTELLRPALMSELTADS
jgi:phosphoribosyl 1,2-cyclic phosphodiesterase